MNQQRSRIITQLSETFRDLMSSSASGGIILLVCTAAAMFWANSPWSAHYTAVWEQPFTIALGDSALSKSLLHWINDGLMVIFFFFVGLEIKREILVGELSSFKKAFLPLIAALGGMVGPALIYLLFNNGDPETARGWGIPMATDIAFALGILALLGDKVPSGLKVFLAALAIADDMGAVLVIALFYTQELSLGMLAAGGGFLLLLLGANRLNIRSTAVYTLLGIGLWFCFLKSGVHATIAGVLLAATIPVRSKIDTAQFIEDTRSSVDALEQRQGHTEENERIHHIAALSEAVQSPLHRFEHALQPAVAFFIMPLFAFANAGVTIQGSILDALLSPVGLGVSLGLIIGKQAGIFSFVWCAVRLNLAVLPAQVTWGMLYGMTWLCAIGFTMSLFIAGLAFGSPEPLVVSKIAILCASTVSAVIGYLLLYRLRRRDS
ncbi:MAG: Na+/H+ antiporter NhaA [Bacteroidetes bacterium]|nr:Na+/H+ antiporter NhaA [Bacteroidota bacterium]